MYRPIRAAPAADLGTIRVPAGAQVPVRSSKRRTVLVGLSQGPGLVEPPRTKKPLPGWLTPAAPTRGPGSGASLVHRLAEGSNRSTSAKAPRSEPPPAQ